MALQREQREGDLVKKVQEAIVILNERGEMPTRVAIGHSLRIPLRQLRSFSRVKALLEQGL